MPVSIRYEQAVYGSFPFWDKGYAILARSPGCRDEWIADLRAVCQHYGERPAGAAEAGGVLALKLPSGPWAIIGPCPQGCDDQGRPGALAFHALFVSGSDYRKAGAFPFNLARNLGKDWSAEATSLPSGSLVLDTVPPADPSATENPQAARIAEALARGRRVALEAPGPIDDLARVVWLALPLRRRARLSLATWTFALGNRHDLAALPRLAGVALDRTYVDPESLLPGLAGGSTQVVGVEAEGGTPGSRAPCPGGFDPNHTNPGLYLTAYQIGGRILWLSLTAVALSTLSLPWLYRAEPTPLAVTVPAAQTYQTKDVAPPDRRATAPPVSRKRVEEGLFTVAERFGTLDTSLSATDLEPDVLMKRLRERLSYRDSFLTSEDLGELKRAAESTRPLAWHAHILLFRPDRPLPADFARGSLDWQLRVLAWSFHLDPGHRPAEEIPRFLSESLSPPFPIHSTPLAERFPALKDYARFLRRLPAR